MPNSDPQLPALNPHAELRRRLARVLIGPSEFGQFCCVYFSQIRTEYFANGMDRKQQLDYLLAESTPEQIALALDSWEQNEQDSREGEREAETFQRQWAANLQELHDEKYQLIRDNRDLADVNQRIKRAKRYLRQGPQLVAGDFLADRYRLDAILGSGGFGEVWLAQDRMQQQAVAVKVLHGQYCGDQTYKQRFNRGAVQMAKLSHPNIVRVLQLPKKERGYYYFVMEYLPRGDLGKLILDKDATKTLSAVKSVLEVGAALHYAHTRAEKFVHRDVKPANILLDQEGTARLTDFDLVAVGNSSTIGMTRTRMAMGSFMYAAPEQFTNAAHVDFRADIYSLGVTMLHVLHGGELSPSSLVDVRALLRELSCPSSIKSTLSKAIETKPEQRFQSAQDFCAAITRDLPELDKHLQRKPRSALRVAAGLAAISVGLAVGGTSVYRQLTGPQRTQGPSAAQAAATNAASRPSTPERSLSDATPPSSSRTGALVSTPEPALRSGPVATQVPHSFFVEEPLAEHSAMAVQAVLRKASPAVARCFAAQVAPPRHLPVRLTQDSGGYVTEAATTIELPAAERTCLLATLQRLRLPPLSSGDSYSTEYDFDEPYR